MARIAAKQKLKNKPNPENNSSLAIRVMALGLLVLVVFALPLLLDTNLPGKLPLQRVLLNILPVGLIALVILGVTRRSLLSFVWVVSLVGFLFYVNILKFSELQEPLVTADFLLIGQVVTGFDLLYRYVDIPKLVVACIVFLALCLISWKWERPLAGPKTRLVLVLLPGVLLISLAYSGWLLGALYRSDLMLARDWNPRENVRKNGLIATLARSGSNVLFVFPDIDQATIQRPDFLPANPPLEMVDPADLPDIIVVLSESFFDPAVMNGVESCEYLLEFCTLKSQGKSGWLTVPAYGGNTTRTEFELLTGIPFALFSGLDYPYLSVVTRPVYSLPWHLKTLGYQTTAIHTHERTFWRRHSAMPKLGFDQFTAKKDIEPAYRSGFWIADSVLTREIKARLERQEQDKPQFVFAISMENHGTWNAGRLSRLPDWVAGITVPDAVKDIPGKPLQQFLYHEQNAVSELEKLAGFVQQRPRKTVLVFFGDHLPALTEVFEILGFDNDKNPWEQLLPYVVMSNFPLDYRLPQQMHSHQLMLQTLYSAGIPLSESYAGLRAAYAYRVMTEDDGEKSATDAYLLQLQTRLLHHPVR
jgi:phosphoglycerol transferase MdoB-like AlkP superfamily enzyme